MEILRWLQDLGKDADPTAKGFQAKPMYVFMSVMLPVLMGLLAGYGMRLL